MKTASVALKAHLAGESLTICTLWKITRKDATVFGFTDCTHDLVYDSVTYYASTGQIPSNIKTTSSLAVDNLEITSILNSSSITESDLQAGKWDLAVVEISIVNYLDLTMGKMILRKGTLGEVRNGRQSFTAELRGMTQPLQQNIGRIYTANCDAILGDARCGKVLTSFTVTGSVTTATSAKSFNDTARNEAAGYFNGGVITWTSGNNNTYRMEVKTNNVHVIDLQQSMPNPTVIGNTYSMIAGCDKTLATCRDKFNNVANFRGFPYIPGLDAMVSGV